MFLSIGDHTHFLIMSALICSCVQVAVFQCPQAMALKAFPSNAPSSLESLCLLVDDLWYGAGDRSTDLNWYSKRAILAAVYSATGRRGLGWLAGAVWGCLLLHCTLTWAHAPCRAVHGPGLICGLPGHLGLPRPQAAGHSCL